MATPLLSRSVIGLVAVLALFGATGEARAQGGSFGSFPGLEIAFGVVDGSFAAAGVLTGIQSTLRLARGQRSPPWFIASAITGAFNLGVGVAAIAAARAPHLPGLAFYPEYVALGVGHRRWARLSRPWCSAAAAGAAAAGLGSAFR